jgi:hypothetical protein
LHAIAKRFEAPFIGSAYACWNGWGTSNTTPYKRQYPFGWQAISLNKYDIEQSPVAYLPSHPCAIQVYGDQHTIKCIKIVYDDSLVEHIQARKNLLSANRFSISAIKNVINR